MKLARYSTLTVALAVVLAGCATNDGAATPPAAPPSTSPTPGAVQERETGLVPPTRPFGGDCNAFMSESEATAIFGSPAELWTRDSSESTPEVTVELYAGFSCRWRPVDGAVSFDSEFVILPEGAVSYNVATPCEDAGEWWRIPFCPVESVVNGTRLSGHVWREGDSTAAVESVRTAILALFDERASAATPAPVPIPAVGAWALPVDCTVVVAAGDFSDVRGIGAGAVGTWLPNGTDVRPITAQYELVDAPEGAPFCVITGEAADVTFVAMGGGRWLESTVAENATPFAIEGYESAYVRDPRQGSDLSMVDVFDGPNWLHFQIRYTSNAKALADALFAALDTTAAA